MNNEERDIINKTKELIDELKSISENNGIGNSPSEYKIITEVFLYKFLNDKFLYEIKKVDESLAKLDKPKDVEEALVKIKDEYDFLLLRLNPDTAKLKIEHLISYLFTHKNDEDFYKLFDKTLIDVANFNIDIFSVRTGGKEKIRLFTGISQHITETSKKNNFARAIIDKLVEFSFEDLFKQKYDAFAIVFEYLIKDYNKDFGKYAEYYTPNSIARVIARILVEDDENVENVTLYDPSAGSGTLLLALAHQIGEENCTIYSQDISQKSNEFLRLNLILNNLVHSLGNVVHGNTLTEPAHYNETRTRLAEFDYIVSNPPFKTDFSEYRDDLADDKLRERFFAGVPNTPKEKIDSMAIYLMFIQHILFSLGASGKAAIVVPTGFLTAKNGIEYRIREKIINNNWLNGVVSMPSNIFANTGTNVSIMFIDKNKKDDKCILIDATSIGKSEKIGKIKKTVLSMEEQQLIVDTFNKKDEIQDFSVIVKSERIKNNKYLFNAGQYFDVQFENNIIGEKEFNNYFNKISLDINKISDDEEIYLKDFVSSISNLSFIKSDIDMTYNELLNQEIPRNWEVKKLDECIEKISTGLNPRNHFKLGKGNIKYITVKNLDLDDGIDYENCDLIDEDALKLVHSRSDISKGDILFASICPLGRCYLIDEEPKGWDINESVFSIRPDYNVITSEYLYLMFKHPAVIKKLTNKSTGSIFKGIRQDDLLNVYIPIPDKVTMEEISKELRKMIKLKRSISELNKELNKSKEFILPLLMNGQVGFKD